MANLPSLLLISQTHTMYVSVREKEKERPVREEGNIGARCIFLLLSWVVEWINGTFSHMCMCESLHVCINACSLLTWHYPDYSPIGSCTFYILTNQKEYQTPLPWGITFLCLHQFWLSIEMKFSLEILWQIDNSNSLMFVYQTDPIVKI